jgi:hypothetical protein
LTGFRVAFADFFFAGIFSFLLLFFLKPRCGVGPHCGLFRGASYLPLGLPRSLELLRLELLAWELLRLEPLSLATPPLASLEGLRSRTFTDFFFLSAILVLFLFVGCLVNVSAEEILTPAEDIFFWNQVIESDQFFLFALMLLNP